MKSTPKTTQAISLFYCLGIIVGIIALVFGIITLTADPDRYAVGISNSVVFGSDYSTYTYAAEKATANNLEAVFDVLRIIQNAFGYILIISGLLTIFNFTVKVIINVRDAAKDISANNTIQKQSELETLKKLFETGAITQDEYNNKKKEILGI